MNIEMLIATNICSFISFFTIHVGAGLLWSWNRKITVVIMMLGLAFFSVIFTIALYTNSYLAIDVASQQGNQFDFVIGSVIGGICFRPFFNIGKELYQKAFVGKTH